MNELFKVKLAGRDPRNLSLKILPSKTSRLRLPSAGTLEEIEISTLFN